MAEASITAIREGLKDLTISKTEIKSVGGEIGRAPLQRPNIVQCLGIYYPQ